MLEQDPSNGEFWCPVGEKRLPRPELDMSPGDWAALSRFSLGEWISDAQIDRLQSLGLLEKVFGQALLTRLGRSTIGISE